MTVALVVLVALLGACVRDLTSKPMPVADLVGRWHDERGRPAPNGLNGEPLVLHVAFGPSHCNWDSAVFLHLAWPVGKAIEGVYTSDRLRQYIRDPDGVVSDDLSRRLDLDASLPPTATFAGYRRGGWELWLGTSNGTRDVYLVGDGRIERWPRLMPMTACA